MAEVTILRFSEEELAAFRERAASDSVNLTEYLQDWVENPNSVREGIVLPTNSQNPPYAFLNAE